MLLKVTVTDTRSASSRTFDFTASPVRIGRNQLNDIALPDDPFVSEWHGLLRFDDSGGLSFLDLGSTNGTMLDGRRLPKNTPTPMTAATRLQVGKHEMVATRPPPVSRPGFPVPPELTGGSGGSGGPTGGKTLAFDTRDLNLQRPAPVRRGASVPPVARSERPSGSVPTLASLEGERLTRAEKALDAFAEAFVGLKHGYQEFGAQVGVRTINGSTPLHRARAAKEVVAYLLDPDGDPTTRSRDLIGIFADFGIHHIAMMDAITKGVQALLQSLEPGHNGVEPGSGLFSRSHSKDKWRAYLERYATLLADDAALHAEIFGEEFVRAYAGVTQGEGAHKDDGGQE